MKNQVNTIYRQAERFAEITQKAIVSGNIHRAKKCLAIAEDLLRTGSNETKMLFLLSMFFCVFFYGVAQVLHF